MTATIMPSELQTALRNGAGQLIDVRSPAEFDSVHIPGAINVPLERLTAAYVEEHFADEQSPLYVVCQAGGRSRQAVDNLTAAGLRNLVDVCGGTNAWVAAGLPVVRGRQTLPVDAQVRIVAGSLILLGLMLGALVHPAGFFLSAFVGAGLLVAGIRNSCPMANVIARMPWNQRGGEARTTRKATQ